MLMLGFLFMEALKMSNTSRRTKSTGEIINLMSVDCDKIEQLPVLSHYLWNAPLMTLVTAVVLWQYLGPYALTGLLAMIAMLVVNFVVLVKLVATFQVR